MRGEGLGARFIYLFSPNYFELRPK